MGLSFAKETAEKVSRAMLGRNSTDLGLSLGERLGGGPAVQVA